MLTSKYFTLILSSLLLAQLSFCLETYHILRLFGDETCSSTHFATRFLPSGCATSMGSFYKRDYNNTHMWTSMCTDSECNSCAEPQLYSQIDRCSTGIMRSAGEASQLFFTAPLENNILVYYRSSNSCSPTRGQIEEVRATPDTQICHAPAGTSNRFYFRCSPMGLLQLVNCTSPLYGSCGNPATCTTTDYPENLTSLCLNDANYDITVTYSCNYNHFLAGNRLPPASNFFLNLEASAQAPSTPPSESSTPTSSPNMSPVSAPVANLPVASSPMKSASSPAKAPSASVGGTLSSSGILLVLILAFFVLFL
jgi:hypothetical protein